jgi:uncharacterized membrane protein YfcA
MGLEQVAIVLAGALAGGVVNGLTGFGTAITALGIWVYGIPPAAAASLSIICAAVSQTQTLHLIWRSIQWKRALCFIIPGAIGVPIGTLFLPHVDPKLFKFGLGLFLVIYPAYVLLRRRHIEHAWGGEVADGVVGFGGGILGGLTGLSGVLPVIWTDVRGWSKEQRRAIVQFFNLAILSLALVTHAVSGMLTRQIGLDAMVALPATIGGAWFGAFIYRRLADHSYQRIIMMLLVISGMMLMWTSR